MNASETIRAKARDITTYLADCEARCRTIEDESDQLAILAEALTVLGAEVIHATVRAAALEERLAELEGEREAVPGLSSMWPLM